ncbi:hypothetical protein KBD87_02230 [Candidatus Saccharibacteria bacterium]|nr:hypothetical protein [Candidatus Saccharibacteria bacterium]
MNANKGNRFLPLLIVIVIIVLVIIAIVAIGRALLSSSTPAPTTQKVNSTRQALLTVGDTRSVSMIVRGPIVADEDFRSYKISVSPDHRTMDVYKGYLDTRTNGTTLGNNEKSYTQFVHALDKADFANVLTGKISSDLRGICATGYVYEFQLGNDGKVVKTLWTSTCSGSKGNLGASKDQLGNLFRVQIPNASQYIPFETAPILTF